MKNNVEVLQKEVKKEEEEERKKRGLLHRIRKIRRPSPKRSQLIAQKGTKKESGRGGEVERKKLVTPVECIIPNESAPLCPKGSDVVFLEQLLCVSVYIYTYKVEEVRVYP